MFDNKISNDAIEEMAEKMYKIKPEDSEFDEKDKIIMKKYTDIINIDICLEIMLECYVKIKNKVHEKLLSQYKKEECLSEAEFCKNLKEIFGLDQETSTKFFELYAVFKKDEDEKVEKVIRIESLLSILVDNFLIDIKVHGI